MTKRIYVIYDRTAEECGPLFEAPNDGVALRSYRQLMEKLPVYQKADFRLYKIAAIDPHTMQFQVEISPVEVLYEEKEVVDA